MKNLFNQAFILCCIAISIFACQPEEINSELNPATALNEKPVIQLQDYSSETMIPSIQPYVEGSWKMLSLLPHARLFGLQADDPKAAEMLALYEAARQTQTPVQVEFGESNNHDFYIVKNIRELSAEESRDWKTSQSVQGAELRGYSSYLSNYQAAASIFNYMRNFSCNASNLQGCIPFNYVADGCYARAHIMKKLMEEKFGVTCQKIVTIGLNDRQTLNVYSSQGCCVSWRWHIAPLVYVWQNGQWLDYVIDPSMFTQPVRASQWVNAQANRNCNSFAQVGMVKTYSGDVYAVNPLSGSISYDYGYSQTIATLKKYSTKRGCN